jgi:plastocyanin
MRAFAITLVFITMAGLTAVLFSIRSEIAQANHSSPGTVDTHISHVHDNYFHPEPLMPTWADHNAAQISCQAASPASTCDLTIEVGDSVEWWTKDPFHAQEHTVTECADITLWNSFAPCVDNPVDANPIGDSGTFAGGASANTIRHGPVTFTAPGTYLYKCNLHPDVMRGRVVVAAQQTPTPSPTPTSGSPTASPTGAATASPTPSGLPAAAPATGGTPSGGSAGWLWLVAAVGGAIVVASAATGVGLLRRR